MPKKSIKKTTLTLQSLLQYMPDLYLIINPHFEIEEVSKEYAIATKVKREEILGRNLFEVFPPNFREDNAVSLNNLHHSLERVLKSKKIDSMAVQKYDLKIPGTNQFEERYWSPVNTPILGEDNKVKHIIHRVQDVTEFIRLKQQNSDIKQKNNKKDIMSVELDIYRRAQEIEKAYEELRKSEERLRLMVEATKDYAILMLDPKGYITTWNEGAERIKGYSADEIIGKHFSIFYTQEARDQHHPEYELKVAKEEGRYEEEGWRIRKDGSKFWANVIITPIYDPNAQLLGFGKVTRDLTERKRIETVKNEFISVVSHELRTPLTSIRGSISLLLGGAVGQLPEKATDLLTIADTNCDRLIRLINDILDIEKIEDGKMKFNYQIYDVGALVKEAISINQIYAEKFGVKIICPKFISMKVKVDTDRLMQVLTNLISNAVKFSKKGEDVSIVLSRHDNMARVSVTNRGAGIPKEFQDKIFSRFTQADSSTTRREGGTGLGLAISKAIIERMNGTIHFNSVSNKETTFYIEIPLAQEQKATYKEEYSPAKTASNANTLLICEDDEEQANYLSAMLQGAGYQTDVCSTAAQAMRFLNERTYYALLLDLLLPDKNGIELIKELRQSKAHKVPIIVVSIMAKEGKKIINGNAIEVVDWLSKPLDFNKLSNAFSEIKKHIPVEHARVLHVEDDIDIQKMISNLLQDRADITAVQTLKASRSLLKNKEFDLVILDLILPDGDGAELLPDIATLGVPVIVFARDQLSPKYAQYVNKVLIKSRTSSHKLLETINNCIRVNNNY